MKIICDCGREAFDTSKIPPPPVGTVPNELTKSYGLYIDTKGKQPEDFPDTDTFTHIVVECPDPNCKKIPLFVGWNRLKGT